MGESARLPTLEALGEAAPLLVAVLGERARLASVEAVVEAPPARLVQILGELPAPPVQNGTDALPLPPAEAIIPLPLEEVRGEVAACAVGLAISEKTPPPGHVLPGAATVLLWMLPTRSYA